VSEAVSGRVAAVLERVQALEPVIRAHADQSERESRLAAPIVDAMPASPLI
jgi:hypothetical protein